MRGEFLRLAVISMFVVVVLCKPSPGLGPGSNWKKVEAEKKEIQALFAVNDVDGLIKMLSNYFEDFSSFLT